MSRRGATDLAGILAIDKPGGMTSHDVVEAVRRATGERRVGHAGTLDPAATGLLVVLVGPATRLEPYISSAQKAYEAEIAFGISTDTDDAEGETLQTLPVPDDVFTEARAREILACFVGTSMQVPPAYAAIKVGGKKAYETARKGGELELAPRPVVVHEAVLRHAHRRERTWDVLFVVSKGTYVRALARDIGTSARTAAHLSALRRMRSGTLDLDTHGHSLDDALAAAAENRLPELFADPLDALGIPVVEADPDLVRDGRPLPASAAGILDQGTLVAVAQDGRLLGVYRVTAEALVATTVIPGGVSGGSR